MISSEGCKGCRKHGSCGTEDQAMRDGKMIIGCSAREATIKLVRRNYDRIVYMLPSELAQEIARFISGCYGCEASNESECVECIKNWLDMEVDE